MCVELPGKQTRKDSSLDAAIDYFKDNPAIFITGLYLWTSTIGVIYTWRLYSYFGISVFDFAETNDFLMAGFKEPAALLTSLIAPVALIMAHRLLITKVQDAPTTSALLRGALRPLANLKIFAFLLAFYILFGPVIAAFLTTQVIRSGERSNVKVISRSKHTPNQEILNNVCLLGTTEKFVILYDRKSQTAFVVPITNVARIEVGVSDK